MIINLGLEEKGFCLWDYFYFPDRFIVILSVRYSCINPQWCVLVVNADVSDIGKG